MSRYRLAAIGGAVRVPLVHVPEGNRREELMIVYAEAPDPAAAVRPSEIGVQLRAREGLRVVAVAP